MCCLLYTSVTAGSSGVYPEKLVIGTVKEVKIQTNGISSYAVVETAVDIEQVTEVLVLKNFAGKGSANLPAEE